MVIKIPKKEYIEKCPLCHNANVSEFDTDKTYGLAEQDKNGKLSDKNFIPVHISRCPACGAIFLKDADN